MFNKKFSERMELLSKKADEIIAKHTNSETVLIEMLVSAHLAFDKAVKQIDRMYVTIGKAAERRQQADAIIKKVNDELGDDE